MVQFIDNKGCGVVPSLETIVMMSEGLTEEKIRGMADHVKKLIQDMHQRLDYKVHRTDDHAPVYLASDITARGIPCHSMELNLSRKSYGAQSYFRAVGASTLSHKQEKQKQWTRIKQLVLSRLSDIEAIIVTEARGYDFLLLRPSRGSKMAVEITPVPLDWLVTDGIDLSHVKRLFLTDTDYIVRGCQQHLPVLSSLDIQFSGLIALDSLVSLRHTLRELRINFDRTNFLVNDEFKPQIVLKQLFMLQLLYIYFSDANLEQPPQCIESWELPSSLRSLGLDGFKSLEAINIIQFLTSEVDYKDEKVVRQALLDDLTIIDAKDGVMEAVYRSEQLTQRIKDRIYSDVDRGHLAATYKLMAARHENFFVLEPSSYYDSVQAIFEARHIKNPDLIYSMASEQLQYLARNSYQRRFDESSYLSGIRNISSDEILNLHPNVLRDILDAHACLSFNSDPSWHRSITAPQMRQTANLVKLAEGRQVTASTIPRYMGLLLTLMINPLDRDAMVTLFMKHFNQLTPEEKKLVMLKDNEMKLVAVFLLLMVAIPAGKMNKRGVSAWTFRDDVKLTRELLDMINVVRKYHKKEGLTNVCSALLRRSKEDSVPGKWTSDYYAVQQDKRIRKIFPSLVSVYTPFKLDIEKSNLTTEML